MPRHVRRITTGNWAQTMSRWLGVILGLIFFFFPSFLLFFSLISCLFVYLSTPHSHLDAYTTTLTLKFVWYQPSVKFLLLFYFLLLFSINIIFFLDWTTEWLRQWQITMMNDYERRGSDDERRRRRCVWVLAQTTTSSRLRLLPAPSSNHCDDSTKGAWDVCVSGLC